MAVMVLLAGVVPAAAAPGLDQRPPNPNCVAAPLESGSSNVTAVNAFAPLKFAAATQVRQHPLEDNRYYVAERRGIIRTFRLDGGVAVDDRVALDIRDRMANTAKDTSDSEQWGITSFAFGPGFGSARGDIYVVYNRRMPGSGPVRSHLSRFSSTDGRTFNAGSERTITSLDQPGRFHHWGQAQFGPDGFLYLGSGDGSNSALARNRSSRFGKILKVNVATSQVQVFALGMRNPWRFSVDGADLWVGDVGRTEREEIDRMRLSQPGGDYGWPLFEGDRCVTSCSTPGLIRPVHAFGHDIGAAVIGGEVYRGSAIPALQGRYIFGVTSGPSLFALVPPDYGSRIAIGRLPSGRSTGFFRNRSGEIFVNDATASAGPIWRIVPVGRTGGAAVASRLSDTGCMGNDDHRQFARGVIPYDVNMPLWSDALDKRRGIGLADGAKIAVRADGDFDLPPRTVLLKTFLLENKMVETRVFMNHPGPGGGWRGYSYQWNGSGARNDADLLPGSKVVTLRRPSNNAPVTWQFPSREQCMQCHTGAAGTTLGLELIQLNRNYTYASTGRTGNQIETWRNIGLFSGGLPSLSDIDALAGRSSGTTVRRARSYLHANCSFCHRPGGGARVDMDFRFTTSIDDMRVCDINTAGELRIPGAKRLYPGDPNRSMIPIRMGLRNTSKMPPLGSFVVDATMLGTIKSWIRTPGVCD